MKNTTSFLTLLLIVFCQTGICQSADVLEKFIQEKMQQSKFVGLGAAVIVDKKVVWSKGFGYADLENKKPFTAATILNAGSIGKTFTGVAIMHAIEEGKLSLDEDINNYLPFKVINPHFPEEKITLRNIATHTSGIFDRDSVYNLGYINGEDPTETLEHYLRNYLLPAGKYYSAANFLPHKPGTYREYSNIAAALAGYIVEIKTGRKLNAYTKKYIFNPLQMKDTGWFFSEINLSNHSRLYYNKDGVATQIPLYGLTTYPDGGVRTSVTDLSRFFIALLSDGSYNGGRILKPASVEQMLKFQFTASLKPENVDPLKLNSGIFWATKQNGTYIGHGGTDPGIKAEMLALPSKDVAVILFINTTLEDSEVKNYSAILSALFKYGSELKATGK